MKKTLWIASAVGLACVATAVVALRTSARPEVVYHRSWEGGHCPPNVTEEEWQAFLQAQRNDTALPPGFTRERGGELTAVRTGVEHPELGFQLVVTLQAPVERARLLVDSALASQASQVDGNLLVVDGGQAVATMTAWLPDRAPFEVELQWKPADGDWRRELVRVD